MNDALHPSRSALLCIDCAHRLKAIDKPSICAHPNQPVSLVTGEPVALCEVAREKDPRYFARGHAVQCGPEGRLYLFAKRGL